MEKRMKVASLAGCILVLILLAGCATSATQYAPLPEHLNAAPAPGKARICVIRGWLLAAMAVEHHLREDGVPRGNLINGSYVCWERPPGVAQLSLGEWDIFYYQGNLPVEADMVYYLYMDYFSPQLKSIPPKEGQKYLAEYSKPRVSVGNAPPSALPGQAPPAGVAVQAIGAQGGGPTSPSNKRVGY